MQFSLKSLIVMFLLVSFSLTLCTGISVSLIEYSKTGADWVSALIQTMGNISGGIIGGIVAYIVAKYQIEKQLSAQDKVKKISISVRLKLIKEELLDNKSSVQTIVERLEKGDTSCVDVFISGLSMNTWENSLGYIDITDDLLKRLSSVYRRTSIIKRCGEIVATDVLNQLIEKIDKATLMIDDYCKLLDE